jgi:N-acetylglucosaminyldiphosphoundecaprenol N-acetyl-beta-D-mannosaminyltransferase
MQQKFKNLTVKYQVQDYFSMQKKRFLSLDISLGTYDEFIRKILYLAHIKQSSYVCVANVHMLVEAHKDDNFQAIVNNADIITPDGMPLAKGLKFLYGIKQDRVAGMDILPDLLKFSEGKFSVFFYGGTPKIVDKINKYCKHHYPELNIVGAYAPPFRELTEKENREVIEIINTSGADFVFVALGCPKQERWMYSMKGKINCCMLGIGGALPVMLGLQKRAPIWMQRSSLEWLYRLYQEPKRLFKRYFITNNIFVYLLLSTYLKNKFGGRLS